ncbi:MAG: SDR family NAD(P)-dependent oxidoreductase [Acidobacteria bacterium]|nr:SDR family NAD(P)-dependent oxidoreductase [Acidobacteriota bacterium]
MSEQRTALVTGANRGIGLEVCRQLAATGLRVILTARDGARADAAAATLADSGEVVAATLDVTDEHSVSTLAADLSRRGLQVDVLVNNAAVLVGESIGVLETAVEDLRATFETNLFGVVLVSQAFVPGMIARRYGRVVNVSSQAGQLLSMGTYAPAYSMSKAALNAFTRQLASAAHGRNVLVNSADPGWVRTAMGGPSAPRSVEQGADTLVWLATLPAKGPTGGFFSDRKPIDW